MRQKSINTLGAFLLAPTLFLAGCGSHVEIKQYAPEKTESAQKVGEDVKITGTVFGLEYTPNSQKCLNKIIFQLKQGDNYKPVYVQGSQNDQTDVDLNYAMTASKLKTLQETNSQVTITGIENSKGIKMKTIESKLGPENVSINFKDE